MTERPRVTLILDPFAICKEAGLLVSDFQGERQAFREIDDLLRRDARLETVVPKTFIVSASSVEHFKSYYGVKGVEIKNVSPRTYIRDIFHSEPPDWLTDDDICKWRLLQLPAPDAFLDEGWATTIADWLVPGIANVASLEHWLRIAAETSIGFSGHYGSDPVSSWVQEQFACLATDEVASREIVSELRSELTRAESPASFAYEWIRRKALLPLTRASQDGPLRVAGLKSESARARALADQLPLPFPMPEPLHEEISSTFCQAVQQVRIREKHRLSEVINALNAVWRGIPEEIRSWLEVYPRGLDRSAADHLQGLPGFDSSDLSRKLIEWYRPPERISPWSGLKDPIEEWVASYAKYIRSCFLRRDLNENDDPASEFGRWLKDNPTVSFDHRLYSYFRVARSVQKALKANRTVLLMMVDAFPIHLAADFIDYASDGLGEEPSTSSSIFVPIPTVTDVCKEAVLTGTLPLECRGELRTQLQQRFGLGPEEIRVAANWQDAERLQIEPDIRLIVYRDNRLDDQLHKLASYRAMLEDSHGVFQRIAGLLKRWANDIRCVRQESPLIVVTADHGFTYGPAPGKETAGHRALDGSHRCVVVNERLNDADVKDESVTVIDKDVFRLRSTYLAARGRCFGVGTMSGWSMSHGGLLPEEVIVPFLEWFGQEESVLWPHISFPEGIVVDQEHLIIEMRLRNEHAVATSTGSVTLGLSGEDVRSTIRLPSVAAGSEDSLNVQLKMASPPEGETLPIGTCQ